MDKFKKIAPWVTVALYLVVMLVLTGAKHKDVKCKQVTISIAQNSKDFFVEEADVKTLLADKGKVLLGQSISQIDVNQLEELLVLHPSIKMANVYRNLEGQLHIDIEQRKPILRVINNRRESYYIDEQGALMPLSAKYAAHVLVASGDIDYSYGKNKGLKLDEIELKNVDNSQRLLFDLYQLASYIYEDKFWSAQIEQIYVKNGELELVPRVGSHIIEFGDATQYKTKLRNLRALYQDGFRVKGWNKYDRVNLKYNNQVICTKR